MVEENKLCLKKKQIVAVRKFMLSLNLPSHKSVKTSASRQTCYTLSCTIHSYRVIFIRMLKFFSSSVLRTAACDLDEKHRKYNFIIRTLL
jgi:hypothetical protein